MPLTLAHVARQADHFKQQFAVLLSETIRLSNGLIARSTIQSAQYYTRFTEAAEQAVRHFTGIETDPDLTQAEYDIVPAGPGVVTGAAEQAVHQLNASLLTMVTAFARFKSELLENQTACRIVTFLYTAELNHVLQEALRYQGLLTALQNRDESFDTGYDAFWDMNMAGHSKSMRGRFDPTEAQRIAEADRFARMFDALAAAPASGNALQDTQQLAVFKADTTQGILSCGVKSLMNPLYTDHLLREANHYAWLLQG
jgi:hypothetical protein